MIYPLIQVTGGIDKIYDVPLVLLQNAQLAINCEPKLFPLWFRPVYNRCPGVKDRFEILFKAFKKLSGAKQRNIIDIYRTSRNVQNICSDDTSLYPLLTTLDKNIQGPLKSLFEFLFNETIGTDIFQKQSKMHIDAHYKKFQNKNNVHVCPFCGLETYTLPEFRRAEYDHYLPISIYPWLGVNLNNLVPMGDHCNGKKNAANILYSDAAATVRRQVWYPYEWINHSMSIVCKKKPNINDIKGEWEITFKANTSSNQSKIDTWTQVFEISKRFNNSLSTYHKRFIEDFAHKNELKGQRLTLTGLKDELRKYRDNGIGNIKLETMAKLKFLWADYYIKTTDKSQLAVLINFIAHQTSRVKP